jgi:hypothetical protein
MSEVLRNFWKTVVGIEKPLRKQPDGAAVPEKPAAPEPKAPAGEGPAVLKAAVLKRLAALVEPFKQAVAAQGPNVPQLHALFGTVKAHVGKQQFADAAGALDGLEGLLAQPAGPDQDVADLEKLVATPAGEQPEKAAAPGGEAPVKGINPLDLIPTAVKPMSRSRTNRPARCASSRVAPR